MNAHLLKDLETLFVYQIPCDQLEEFRIAENNQRSVSTITGSESHELKDLQTCLRYRIPVDELEKFAVPDHKLGYLLDEFDVKGISKPFLEKRVNIVNRTVK